MAAYFSAYQIIEFGRKFVETATAIENTAQKSVAVFGKYRAQVQAFARANAKDFGLTIREFEDLAASTQDLLVPIGFDRKEATQLTLKLQGLTGALTEWSNGKFTAAQTSEILTKALLGEREQLKGLGIDLKDADIKQRLVEKGQSKLTGNSLKQAKALVTLEAIYEKTTDAQTAYKNGGESLERINARNRASAAELGETIAKELTPVYRDLVEVVDRVFSALQTSDQRLISYSKQLLNNKESLEKTAQAVQPLIEKYNELNNIRVEERSPKQQEELEETISNLSKLVPDLVQGFSPLNTALDVNADAIDNFLEKAEIDNKEKILANIEDVKSQYDSLGKQIDENTRRLNNKNPRLQGGIDIFAKDSKGNIDFFSPFKSNSEVKKELTEENRKLIATQEQLVKILGESGAALTDEQNKIYLKIKAQEEAVKKLLNVNSSLQEYRDRVAELNRELVGLNQFSQAAKDKSIELAEAKKELAKQEAQYKKLVGDNIIVNKFVTGSLGFYKTEVQRLEKSLQNTNLESSKAIEVSEKLNKAKEQLAEAQKKYNELIEDEAKIRSFEETAKQLKEVKEALKNIDLPESERNEKIKEAAELQNRYNKELKDYEEITKRIALAANKEIEKPLDPLTPKTEITRSIPDIEKDINFAKEKLQELNTFSPTYVADKNALDAQIESLEKELQRAKLEIPIKPKVTTNTGASDNLDTTRNAFAEFADTELFQVLESLDQVAAGINSINDAVIEGIDRRIAAQENAVSKVSEIADKGNAELLESEQRKLDELQRKRQRFVAAQRALDAIAAISNIIVTITKTSAESGVASPATIPIVLGAIAGGIGAGLALINNIPGAATGEEYINGEGTSTSDSILRRVSKGERVVNAKDNKDYWDTLSAIHNGEIAPKTLNDFVNEQKGRGLDLAAVAAQAPPTLMDLARIRGFELNVNNSSTYENKKLIEQNKVMIQELSKIRQELEYQKQTPPPKKVRRFIPDNNRMIEIEKRAK